MSMEFVHILTKKRIFCFKKLKKKKVKEKNSELINNEF